jgi:hypothetical protein
MSSPGDPVVPPPAARWWHGAPSAIALAMALLVLSFIRLAGDSQSMAVRNNTFDAAFTGPLWGSILGQNLVSFVVALLLLHIAYGLCCWLIARVSFRVWKPASARLNHHVFLWFLLFTMALLASNAGRVPQSSLGEPYFEVARTPLLGMSLWLWIALPILAGAGGTLCLGAFRRLRATPSARKPAGLTAASCAVLATAAVVLPHQPPQVASAASPNVILIGIDSLRADALYPGTARELLPNLYEFTDGAALFTDAITPLARTFPSMTTILTGRHPHRTGAVMNLSPRDVIHEGDTLGHIFGRAGYTSTYATDEVRFSNIDASYGFSQEITPPIGASEIVLSVVADTPLSNLVMNGALGQFLFPHIHANRGAARTYDPDRFLHRIDRETDFRKPLFLVAHLTLAHWPYTWMEVPPIHEGKSDASRGSSRPTWPAYYVDVVKRADQQFGDLMRLLERRGALANAIVVVYSDHGESFGLESEMLTHSPRTAGEKDKWGHGSSVLIPDQYRVVLAMRSFGASRHIAAGSRVIDAPVGVQDIAPTVAGLLGLQSRDPFDGRTLAPLLRNEPDAALGYAGRVRFTETEFVPRNLATPSGEISASVFREALQLYHLNGSTDRLELKRDRLARLLNDRQYAALGQDFLLAALPRGGESAHDYVVIDLKSHELRELPGAPDATAPAEVSSLWQALQAQFGKVLSQPGAGV